ncbi:hypothetical protein CHS0354_014610 [Potamilus streckersoni]|uniref:Uncharacterized protein n=1 Tax=Potamilus streckersoni TaxID=2493646 RepID=A0AAE0RNV6_9BIVA|nr:hypothetical protein CHS0354_014610 [Potamilus streckersoni]
MDIILQHFSDSEILELDEDNDNYEQKPVEARRSSLEEPTDLTQGKKKKKPYRRSHSLAEIRRPSAIYVPEGLKHCLHRNLMGTENTSSLCNRTALVTES